MTLVAQEFTSPNNGRVYVGFKYDPDRTIFSPCGEYAAIFTAPAYAKKPKILRIRIVQLDDYTKSVGYVTFCRQMHNYCFSQWNTQGDYNPGKVQNLTETGPALAARLFAIARSFKK